MTSVLQDTLQRTAVLSGSSLVARSIFTFTPQDSSTIIERHIELRIAYSIPKSYDCLDPTSVSDLNLMPLTVSMTEKLPWIKYHDVWNFTGPNLESHGWAHVPIDRNIPQTLLTYDELGHEDDRKLDNYGKLIMEILKQTEARGLLASHLVIRNHPVYIGLRNNTHYKTRSEVQLPDEDLRLLRHEEIPLYGDLVVRKYKGWIFPPGSESPTTSDLELIIGQAILDDDIDSLLPKVLPLKIVLKQIFKGD